MTKIRLQFVQSFVDQHGKPRFYFRRRGQRRVALPGLPGSTEFMEAYQAALNLTPTAIGASKRSKPGSISLALAQYFDSLPFRELGNGTRVSRKCILERFRNQHGHLPLASLPKDFCVALIDHRDRQHCAGFVLADGQHAVLDVLAADASKFLFGHQRSKRDKNAAAVSLCRKA